MRKLIVAVALVAAQCSMLHAAEGDTISLSEKWLFKIAENVSDLPRHIESFTLDDTQWLLQRVPGVWKTRPSWGLKNYAAAYRGWVKMPANFKGRRVFLHIGFVPAVADIYLNEHYLGQTGEMAQTEFEITPYLRFDVRNLFAFRMPRYQGGEPMRQEDKAGFTTGIYIYALPRDAQLAPAFQPAKAAPGVRVADRLSFEPYRGFIDSLGRMDEDVRMMRLMGFGAVTYNKLSSDPNFIAAAQRAGLAVVEDAPLTSVPFVDANHRLVAAAYAYMPKPDFNYARERRDGELRAAQALAKAKQKVKDGRRTIVVKDKSYAVTFDKLSGRLSQYKLLGTSLMPLSGDGGLRPANGARLVSLSTNKDDARGTTVSAVYDLRDGTRQSWVYTVSPKGVLSLSVPAKAAVAFEGSPRLTKAAFLAQTLDGTATLTDVDGIRPRVLTATLTDAKGNGVKMVGNAPFTIEQGRTANVLTVKPEAADLTIYFIPEW